MLSLATKFFNLGPPPTPITIKGQSNRRLPKAIHSQRPTRISRDDQFLQQVHSPSRVTACYKSQHLNNFSDRQQKWTILSYQLKQPYQKPPCLATPNPRHIFPLPLMPPHKQLGQYLSSMCKEYGNLVPSLANNFVCPRRCIALSIESCWGST